jgi:hypothetical protein
VIDLDATLRPWMAGPPASWGEDAAVRVAEEAAQRRSLRTVWEPGDEQWIRLVADGVVGLLGIRYPLAFVTDRHLADDLERLHTIAIVVDDIDGEQLRASADVLQATVLPPPWSEDFDPDHFTAMDLFVDSV